MPSYVISSSTTNVSYPIAVSLGGTGATSASDAINALIPAQTGNSGKFLSTNGSVVSWETVLASPTLGTDLHWVSGFNGYGSTATKIGKWSTVTQSVTTGGDLTFSSSSVNGDSWTCNVAGLYAMFLCLEPTGSVAATYGISRNASSLTTNLTSLTLTQQLGISSTQSLLENGFGVTAVLAISDVIRVHTNGVTLATGGTNGRQQFWIRRLA